MSIFSKWWGQKRPKQLLRPRLRVALESLEDRILLSSNPIVAENQLSGTPKAVWDLGPALNDTIDGYTTAISYNVGQTVDFKINTPSTNYTINIYRLGYYGGDGARLVASQNVVFATPQVQPDPVLDSSTMLEDYGTWNVSASWQIPATAVSGVYVADLIRMDRTTPASDYSMVPFVVRNDASASAVVYMTSDTTWEAYNEYGTPGGSLYSGSAGNSATYGTGYSYGVSYNRPFTDEEISGGFGTYDFLFHAELPMIMFMEQNGYNVSYLSHPDLDQNPGLLLSHQVFMDCGHDEYWSAGEVAAVRAAQNAGVNCAFFSGNEMYWETRWQPSIDGSNTPYRSLICYKESFPGNPDPETPSAGVWTGTWMDPKGAGTGGDLAPQRRHWNPLHRQSGCERSGRSSSCRLFAMMMPELDPPTGRQKVRGPGKPSDSTGPVSQIPPQNSESAYPGSVDRSLGRICRGDWIRTSDLLNPIQGRQSIAVGCFLARNVPRHFWLSSYEDTSCCAHCASCARNWPKNLSKGYRKGGRFFPHLFGRRTAPHRARHKRPRTPPIAIWHGQRRDPR
jgi:hypothetical protein